MLDSDGGQEAEPDMSGDSNRTNGAAKPKGGGDQAEAKPEPAEGSGENGSSSKDAEPAKGGKKPGQRKTGKRKVQARSKAKPARTKSAKAPTAAKGRRQGAAAEQPGAAAKTGGEPEAAEPAPPEGGKTAGILAGGGAAKPTPSAEAASRGNLAAVSPRERSAASAEPERRGSRLPWILLLLLAVVGGAGYWAWQEHGDLLRQQAQRLQQIVGWPPAEEQAAQAPEPRTEEVELPSAPSLPLAQVTELEELLAQLALDPGEVDGIVDEQTRGAIREFQEMADMPVDGEPSEDVLVALREVAGFQDSGG